MTQAVRTKFLTSTACPQRQQLIPRRAGVSGSNSDLLPQMALLNAGTPIVSTHLMYGATDRIKSNSGEYKIIPTLAKSLEFNRTHSNSVELNRTR